MQTVKITTAQNIEIDYEVADLGERVLGYLIDMGVFLITAIPTIILAAKYAGGKSTSLLIFVFALMALYGFYDLLCEVFFNGQSIGKRIMKIRVISLDGSRPTLSQFFLRWIFRLVDFSLTSSLGALISVAISDKKQRIGDIVAGTTLIKTQPRTPINHVAFNPPAEQQYKPAYPEVQNLTDSEIAVVHEVVRSYYQSQNPTLLHATATKIKEHLGLTSLKKVDDMEFLQRVLKDYNYLAAKVPM